MGAAEDEGAGYEAVVVNGFGAGRVLILAEAGTLVVGEDNA